jgi:hypothetical protein
MNNFDIIDLKENYSKFQQQKMVNKVTKSCVVMYRELENSRILNIIESLQFHNIFEI